MGGCVEIICKQCVSWYNRTWASRTQSHTYAYTEEQLHNCLPHPVFSCCKLSSSPLQDSSGPPWCGLVCLQPQVVPLTLSSLFLILVVVCVVPSSWFTLLPLPESPFSTPCSSLGSAWTCLSLGLGPFWCVPGRLLRLDLVQYLPVVTDVPQAGTMCAVCWVPSPGPGSSVYLVNIGREHAIFFASSHMTL